MFIIFLSFRYPILPVCLFTFTFLDFIQEKLSIFDITPSIYIGAILLIIGFTRISVLKNIKHNKQLIANLLLLLLFPLWMFIRFIIQGSDLRITFTFISNILAIISVILIIKNSKMYSSLQNLLAILFLILPLSILMIYIFPELKNFFEIRSISASFRIMGLIRDPNYAGAFLGVSYFYFITNASYKFDIHQNKKAISNLLALISTIGAVILTVSRGALFSIVIISILYFLIGKVNAKKKFLYFLLFIFISIFLFYSLDQILLGNIVDKFYSIGFDDSNISRLFIFRRGLSVIQDNIIFGTGNYIAFHNTFLDIASYGGIIALIIFSMIIFITLSYNFKLLNENDLRIKKYASFVFFGILVLLSNGLLIGLELEKIFWFMIGLGTLNIMLFSEQKYG